MNNFGKGFITQSITSDKVNDGSMNVTELEVYKVSDGQRQKTTVDLLPWRKTKIWNDQFLEELTDGIVSFKPLEMVTEVRILMIGPVGAGKSSFYNTTNSVLRGRITHRARSGCAEQSLTTTYTLYTVKVRTGASLNFRFCDTRGLEETRGISEGEFVYIIDGNIPDYYQEFHNSLFLQRSTNSADVEKNVASAFKSKNVAEHVSKASQLLGLPRSNVLPVKNYENEVELDVNLSIMVLIALRQILNFAEDYLDNLSDRQKDLEREMNKLKLEK